MASRSKSPWSSLGRILSDPEWNALSEWRKSHPELRLRTGLVREDGKVFVRYGRRCKGGEHWGTPEMLGRLRAQVRATNARLATPEYRRLKNASARERLSGNREWLNKRRVYTTKNRERINAQKRRWHRERYDNDPIYRSKHLAKTAEFARKNRAKVNAALARYRALLEERAHPERDDDAIKSLYARAEYLSRVAGTKHDVDHIIPLSRGGWHHEGNMQVLPRSVNRTKNANPFWVSSTYRDWRSVSPSLWPIELASTYHSLIKSAA